MATNVSADEVRARLLTLTTVDVSDATLALAPYIPVGDAWLNDKLGYTYPGTLTTNQQAFAKAAEIAFVAYRVVTSAPTRGGKYGAIETKPIAVEDKKAIAQILKEEWRYYLNLLGISESDGSFVIDTVGGDEYDWNAWNNTGTDAEDAVLH